MAEVIVARKGVVKPAKRKELEAAGYIVLVVDNVDDIKLSRTAPTPETDDGFNLDASTTH